KYARTGQQTGQGCKRHERGGSANMRCGKVSSHGLADSARLQGARAWRLDELGVQECKLARVSRPSMVARGTSETWQGCKWHERGGSANLRFQKVNSHGLANPARLQEGRARWFGELVVQESKHARVIRPGKFARGTNEIRQGCKKHGRGGSANLRGRKVKSHGLADSASYKGHEHGGSMNLRFRKVSSHGLADPARLQEAWARWLGELAREESQVAGISRLGKLQGARARWLNELAV
ncbi:hypothetical protein CRG98_016672, partial [Punica granatum]